MQLPIPHFGVTTHLQRGIFTSNHSNYQPYELFIKGQAPDTSYQAPVAGFRAPVGYKFQVSSFRLQVSRKYKLYVVPGTCNLQRCYKFQGNTNYYKFQVSSFRLQVSGKYKLYVVPGTCNGIFSLEPATCNLQRCYKFQGNTNTSFRLQVSSFRFQGNTNYMLSLEPATVFSPWNLEPGTW